MIATRVLRWYGHGASTGSAVWAGFRRATITAAALALAVIAIVGSIAGAAPRDAWIRGAEELFYVVSFSVPAGWVVYVAAVTVPGVYRVARRRRIKRAAAAS